MHFIFISLLVTPFILYGGYLFYDKVLVGPSLDGLHVMFDGTIMNAYGETFPGAYVHENGDILDKNGKKLGSIYLGERFQTATDDLPLAKPEPELVTLKDGDTYDLTASYVQKEVGNRALRMLAYNGSVPGPIIKVNQGAEVTIRFTNNTDIEQTIHSHGLRLDNAFDGVPYSTQDPVQPGDTFSYTLYFEDAGVYWYHPHTREDYGQELGLYGNYIVEPSVPGYWSNVNREIPLVVDDILIENDEIASFYKDLTNFALLGRFGNEHLVNGETDYELDVRSGEVIRFFITNVANVRTYNLSIPGAKLKRVGGDLGKYERETFVDSLLISPAERLVVEAYFPQEGVYTLTHTSPTEAVPLATFLAEGEAEQSYATSFEELRVNDEVINEFEPLRKYRYAAPDKELLLTVAISGPQIDHSMHVHMQSADQINTIGLPNIQWSDPGATDKTNTTNTIEWQLVDMDTKKINMDIDDWNFKVGDLVKVTLENDVNAEHTMQHPIHFHGQRFVVLERNGVPNENMVWKDTILLEPGEITSILVEMSNSGEWMVHCHIAEHLHAGMMMDFRVEDEHGNAAGDRYRKSNPNALMHH